MNRLMDNLDDKLIRLQKIYFECERSITWDKARFRQAQNLITETLKEEGLTRYEDPRGNLWLINRRDNLKYVSRESRIRQNSRVKINQVKGV